MTIHCPHCLTGYELPRSLMGELGARVRCPACQGVFLVRPEGKETMEAAPADVAEYGASPEATSHATSGSSRSAPADPGPASFPPEVVAGAVLDVMVRFLGDALEQSRARGTVLSDHGPAIVAVWEEYRRRAGDGAPSAAFRHALKERVGIDLTPRA